MSPRTALAKAEGAGAPSRPGIPRNTPPLKMLNGPKKCSSAFEEMAFVLMHSAIVIVLPGS